MWNASKNTIPSCQHKKHYLGVLKHALEDSDYDPRKPEVYEALDWIEQNTPSTYGVKLYRRGLEDLRQDLLIKGYSEIKRFVKGL